MKSLVQAIVLMVLFFWGVHDYQRFRGVGRSQRRAKKLQGSDKVVGRLRGAIMAGSDMERYRE